ncbi:MAG: type IV secretion system DNA-binding domain-containing protein, partial [Gemmataceae bacterium]|nr:type IV secretion system DNA-binding domain-containing protein [Gemmataceae bacterium]
PPPLTRPEAAPLYWFDPLRGAHVTTAELAQAYLNTRLAAVDGSAHPATWLGGILWPTNEYLNRLTIQMGNPGTAKTKLQELAQMHMARAWDDPARKLRWVVPGVTGEELAFLYRVVPPDVPIHRITPGDRHGLCPNVAELVIDDTTAILLVDALFPEELAKNAGDGRFWQELAKQLALGMIRVFRARGSDWDLADLGVAIEYPPLALAALRQCHRTRAVARSQLVRRLGHGVFATARSAIGPMTTALAQYRHARGRLSLKRFLDERAVLYLGMTADTLPMVAGVANAVVTLLVKTALRRRDRTNHTYFWLDELKYLGVLSALNEVASFGRASGLGAYASLQSLEGLRTRMADKHVAELVEVAAMLVAYSCGRETAEAFTRRVGQVEGRQRSESVGHSYTFTRGTTRTSGGSYQTGRSWGPQGSSSSVTDGVSWSTSWSTSHAHGTSHTASFSLHVKDAVLTGEVTNLPEADVMNDLARFMVFHPNVGCFKVETPFLAPFRDLPPPPFTTWEPRPPEEQELWPWYADEVVDRLKLELTDDMQKALRQVWGDHGGVRNRPQNP